jgi:hypothetical protein
MLTAGSPEVVLALNEWSLMDWQYTTNALDYLKVDTTSLPLRIALFTTQTPCGRAHTVYACGLQQR